MEMTMQNRTKNRASLLADVDRDTVQQQKKKKEIIWDLEYDLLGRESSSDSFGIVSTMSDDSWGAPATGQLAS